MITPLKDILKNHPKFKPTGTFFSVPGIGMLTQKQFELGLSMGAFVKKENIYAICSEDRLMPTKQGNVEKVRVASNKWYEFQNKLKRKEI